MPGLSESIRRRKSSIFTRILKEIDDFWSPGLSRPGLNRKRLGIGKLSVSIGSLLFLIKTNSKIDGNRRIYCVFAAKTPEKRVKYVLLLPQRGYLYCKIAIGLTKAGKIRAFVGQIAILQ